jgi:replicative DNA helicase
LRRSKPKRTASLELERPLPQNLDAERSVLGAILLDNNALNTVLEVLKATDFFHDHHQCIYKRMLVMAQTQVPIDLVTLTDQLHRSGELESSGGPAYIAQLMDGVPHVTNVGHYARIVKEKSLLRGLIHATYAIQQTTLDGEDDAGTIVERAKLALDGIAADAIAATQNTRPNFIWNDLETEDELKAGGTGVLP